MLVPRPAVVLRTEDLPGAAHAVDLIGIPWMERHGHHRALGLDAVVEARPGLAQVSPAAGLFMTPPTSRALYSSSGRAGSAARRITRHTNDFIFTRSGWVAFGSRLQVSPPSSLR